MTGRLLLAPLALVAACHRQAPEVPPGALPLENVAPEEVVATVDGHPISIADVKTQAEAAHTDARTALDALIVAEAAAERAEAKGLAKDPEVIEAEHQALVRRYLALYFEPSTTPDKIPDAELRAVYDRNQFFYDHPDIYNTVHILVQPKPKETEADKAARHRLAEAIAARARTVKSVDEFKALAKELGPPDDPPRVEEVAAGQGAPLVKEFNDAAIALKKPGATSGVVDTSFGSHVIYLASIDPAKHLSFDQAKEDVRKQYAPEYRKRQFGKLTDALVDQHAVQVFPGRLEEKK